MTPFWKWLLDENDEKIFLDHFDHFGPDNKLKRVPITQKIRDLYHNSVENGQIELKLSSHLLFSILKLIIIAITHFLANFYTYRPAQALIEILHNIQHFTSWVSCILRAGPYSFYLFGMNVKGNWWKIPFFLENFQFWDFAYWRPSICEKVRFLTIPWPLMVDVGWNLLWIIISLLWNDCWLVLNLFAVFC